MSRDCSDFSRSLDAWIWFSSTRAAYPKKVGSRPEGITMARCRLSIFRTPITSGPTMSGTAHVWAFKELRCSHVRVAEGMLPLDRPARLERLAAPVVEGVQHTLHPAEIHVVKLAEGPVIKDEIDSPDHVPHRVQHVLNGAVQPRDRAQAVDHPPDDELEVGFVRGELVEALLLARVLGVGRRGVFTARSSSGRRRIRRRPPASRGCSPPESHTA